jgi:hypothetical protein
MEEIALDITGGSPPASVRRLRRQRGGDGGSEKYGSYRSREFILKRWDERLVPLRLFGGSLLGGSSDGSQ